MQFYRNSKWRPTTPWRSRICCHFFSIGPILTNFDGNMAKSIENATFMLKIHFQFSLMLRRPPSWILLNRFSRNSFIKNAGVLLEKQQILMLKTSQVWNVVYIGRIAHKKLQTWFTKDIHTKLKWIVVVSKGKKTRWPIYQRFVDVCKAICNHLIERSNWSVLIYLMLFVYNVERIN